jgi:hypothetical protein
LHQLSLPQATQAVRLFKPRDGHRTRVAPNLLGPMIDYYLPTAASGPVTIDILDAGGRTVNSYSSTAPVASGGRGGRGGGGDPDDEDMPGSGRGGRGGAPPARVTTTAGMNRFVWDVRDQSGLSAPPGRYQARLKVGDATQTQPFTVLIDPRVAESGVTVADLQEQFDHNLRMREMVAEVGRVARRIQEAQRRAPEASEQRKAVDVLAAKVLTEPVRYGKPGLQAHITYLAGMTASVDQKIGRDAIARYNVLRKELNDVIAEANRVLGPESN